jgi:putative endonuclease
MKPRYLQMIEGMQANTKSPAQIEEPWFLYILECNDGTFYTGVTKDLERRLSQHNAKTASKYTRSRLPVKILYHEIHENRASALARECQVKSLSKKAKIKLIDCGS